MIARYQVSSNADFADKSSEKIILQVKQPYENHNGGGLAFGQDGNLYIALGDGGSGGDPENHAQSLDTMLGKILRIDVNHGDKYSIPSDNPFGNEIWEYGLRNPWRFSFDRLTNDMYIGDVGQGKWEEIDYVPAGQLGGLNFGWNIREGFHEYVGGRPTSDFTSPILEYSHDTGGCAITGGYVYRGYKLPAFSGIYLYTDYCTGVISGLFYSGTEWRSQELFQTGVTISTFGQDEADEIYFADYGNGVIYKLGKK